MPKKVGETATIPFNFVGDLAPNETILIASTSAVVYSGVDANPGNIINGAATINGPTVYQSITGGIVGTIYGLVCEITTSLGQVLRMSAFCAIESDLP
jgi:hypothetical protein